MLKHSFNKNWSMKTGISSIMENVFPNAASSIAVTLPHDAMIAMNRNADVVAGASMGFFESDNVEYSKEFVIPAEEKEKVHYLNFDGVYMNATYFINGIYVGKFPNGYTPATMRIDEYLRFDRPNVIKVGIRGSAQPNARWYPGLGIYRDTWLLTGEYVHIAPYGLHVTTLDCNEELASIEVKATVNNASASSYEGYAHLVVRNSGGKEVAKRKARFYVKAGDQVVIRQRIDVENPQLWNEFTPDLYTCECVLVEKDTGKETDTMDATFGIRKLQLDAKHGLRVNGKSVKLKGGCIHHDNGPIGAVSLLDAELRRIRLMKEGGYNAVRTAHNPPSTALLEACDRLGMYVLHEFTDVWTETKGIYDYGEHMPHMWEADMEAVVKRDYNHPSVIMWSIGNEIPELGNPVSNQWGRKLVDKFHQLDSSRFVTNGVNVMVACMPRMSEVLQMMDIDEGNVSGGVNDIMNDMMGVMDRFAASRIPGLFVEEACDMLDLIGYNYSAERYEIEHELSPYHVYYGSETRPHQLDTNWELVIRNPYVIGDFCWTGWDYLGEVGIGRVELMEENMAEGSNFMGRYPWIAAYDSDFDITGFRRPMSYWRETIWNGRGHQPYISVHRPDRYGQELFYGGYAWTDSINSWTWPGCEGKTTAVEVYADAEEVELFVNGKTLGRKPVGDDFRKYYCKWETVYEPGEVLAVAYIGGQETGRYLLKTAVDAKLCVSADKKTLEAGSNQLSYVEIELRDANGTLDMADTRSVTVKVDGPALLAGCGSGNPCTEEKYQDATHALFEGRLLAILRAGEETGKVTVTVSCDGLADKVIELDCI